MCVAACICQARATALSPQTPGGDPGHFRGQSRGAAAGGPFFSTSMATSTHQRMNGA